MGSAKPQRSRGPGTVVDRRGSAAPERSFDDAPNVRDASIGDRLRYIGQLLIGLKDLVREDELAFLRYLLAMAAEEASARARERPEPGAHDPDAKLTRCP